VTAASPVRTFGKYLLDEEIARGGMSRVHLARLRGLGGFEKRLVVKQVLPELASDPRFVSMFVNEAKTLVQMSHPHIAPVYELGVVDGVYFLAMEYVEGATLSQILASGPLAPELVAHLGAQICDALHYAHSRFGIVHRDVTPRNVIVDDHGHARLLDFGIAAPVSGEGGDGLFGTPGYLSPEQANGDGIGPASDVFSLGAVLFEALTARQAFFARNVDEAKEVLTLDGPDFYPEDLVPDTLAAVIDKALCRAPAERYDSARALGRALRSWVASHAPEGVGPELGERVREASLPPPEPVGADLDDDEDEDVGTRPVEVKTLATSAILDELMETPSAPPPADVATAKLDRAVEAQDDEPSTVAIPDRKKAEPPEEEDDESAPPSEPPDPAPPARVRGERPTGPSRAPLLIAFGVATTLAVAFLAWPDPTPGGQTEGPSSDPVPADSGLPALPPDVPADAGTVADSADAGATRVADSADAGAGTVTDAGQDAGVEPQTAPPDRTPPPRGRATLTANAAPWAEVTLDGRVLGNTPIRGRSIRAGPHTVVMRNDSLGAEARASFEVAAGEAVTLIGYLEDGRIQVRR